MALLEDLIRSGRIVDIMLLFVAIEIVALLLYRRRSGGGLEGLPLFLNIGAGASLMLALKFSLTRASWVPVAVCLVAALVFHVADVVQRLREP
ncbi:MAG: hypothetical protein AAFX58_03840 [Pseudomonadota bacterium]